MAFSCKDLLHFHKLNSYLSYQLLGEGWGTRGIISSPKKPKTSKPLIFLESTLERLYKVGGIRAYDEMFSHDALFSLSNHTMCDMAMAGNFI